MCTLQSLSHVWLFATPWAVVCQAPLSMGFPRQEYWSGLPFYLPRRSCWPRVWTHVSCVFCRGFLTTESPGKSPILFFSPHVLFFLFFIFLISILFYFFPFIFISWRLITLQYCRGLEREARGGIGMGNTCKSPILLNRRL